MEQVGKLVVLDIDNTVFNWVEYYVSCMEALFAKVSDLTKLDTALLRHEARGVFEREGSIEYPFLIQELPSVAALYRQDLDSLLYNVVEPGRQAFNTAAQASLVPYPDVVSTLKEMKTLWPKIPIVALTDAPRYVAMWKLNKLGLLPYFDAVYGLPDPRIPTDPETKKVKVDPEILLKHLQNSNFDFSGRVRVLPHDYEKPGTKGLKTVLMDYEMESHLRDVVWVGDNLRKDVLLGRKLGVHTAWARYGTVIDSVHRKLLLDFSPQLNIAKNVALDPRDDSSPQPELVLDTFSELKDSLEKLFSGRFL